MKNYVYVRKSITWGGRRYEVRGKTEEEACAKLAVLVENLRRDDLTASGESTVDQWFRRWKEIYKEPSGLTPKSLSLYDEKYERYIRPAIGHRKVQDIRDLDLQAILNTQAGMSYSHLTKLRMVMQELFRQARRSRLIVYDPAEGLVLPETSRGEPAVHHRQGTQASAGGGPGPPGGAVGADHPLCRAPARGDRRPAVVGHRLPAE